VPLLVTLPPGRGGTLLDLAPKPVRGEVVGLGAWDVDGSGRAAVPVAPPPGRGGTVLGLATGARDACCVGLDFTAGRPSAARGDPGATPRGDLLSVSPTFPPPELSDLKLALPPARLPWNSPGGARCSRHERPADDPASDGARIAHPAVGNRQDAPVAEDSCCLRLRPSQRVRGPGRVRMLRERASARSRLAVAACYQKVAIFRGHEPCRWHPSRTGSTRDPPSRALEPVPHSQTQGHDRVAAPRNSAELRHLPVLPPTGRLPVAVSLRVPHLPELHGRELVGSDLQSRDLDLPRLRHRALILMLPAEDGFESVGGRGAAAAVTLRPSDMGL
jgi:hypothetical protein